MPSYFVSDPETPVGQGVEFEAASDEAAMKHVRVELMALLVDDGGAVDYTLYRHLSDASLADYPTDDGRDPEAYYLCYSNELQEFLVFRDERRVYTWIGEGTVAREFEREV